MMKQSDIRNIADKLMEDFDWISIAGSIIWGIIIVPLLIMAIWNSFVPALFSAPLITFWQAFGLVVLVRLAR